MNLEAFGIKTKKNTPSTNNFMKNFLGKDKTSKDYFTPSRDSENLTAAQKFGGRNIKKLKKLGSGRDRDVYALDQDKVLKIAKNPLGLVQNMSERDLQYLDQLKAYEEGKDYVVMQRASKPGKATTTLLRPLKKFHQGDFDEHKTELQEALEKADLSDIRNFNVAYGDIKAKRNWGEIQGRPVLIDGGALNIQSIHKDKTPEWATKEWREVQSSRRAFRNKGSQSIDPDMRPGRYSAYPELIADLPIPDTTSKEHLLGNPRIQDLPQGKKITTYQTPEGIQIIYNTNKRVKMENYPTPDEVGYVLDNIPLGTIPTNTNISFIPRKHSPNVRRASRNTLGTHATNYEDDEDTKTIRIYPTETTDKQVKDHILKTATNELLNTMRQNHNNALWNVPYPKRRKAALQKAKNLYETQKLNERELVTQEERDRLDKKRFDKFKEVMVHELGHAVDSNKDITSKYEQARIRNKYSPTKYGTKNTQEDIAESFVMWNKIPMVIGHPPNPKSKPEDKELRMRFLDKTIPDMNFQRNTTIREATEDILDPLAYLTPKDMQTKRMELTEAYPTIPGYRHRELEQDAAEKQRQPGGDVDREVIILPPNQEALDLFKKKRIQVYTDEDSNNHRALRWRR